MCTNNPTTVTYRSTLVSPFSTNMSSEHLLCLLQRWVSTAPSLRLDWLLVRINPHCPTTIPRLDVAECVHGESSFLPDSNIAERITTVLNVCAVRQLGEKICNV